MNFNFSFFSKVWLCLCPIFILSACSVRHKTSEITGRNKQVTATLYARFHDQNIENGLTALPIRQIDYVGDNIITVRFPVGSTNQQDFLQNQLLNAGYVIMIWNVEDFFFNEMINKNTDTIKGRIANLWQLIENTPIVKIDYRYKIGSHSKYPCQIRAL